MVSMTAIKSDVKQPHERWIERGEIKIESDSEEIGY